MPHYAFSRAFVIGSDLILPHPVEDSRRYNGKFLRLKETVISGKWNDTVGPARVKACPNTPVVHELYRDLRLVTVSVPGISIGSDDLKDRSIRKSPNPFKRVFYGLLLERKLR